MAGISEKIWEAYWISKFGWPRRKITIEEISDSPGMLDRPIFFLSTGRTGTAWFASVLDRARGVRTFHNPVPNFSMQNEFIYRLWKRDLPYEVKIEIARQIFLTGRGEYMRYAYKSEKRYIETNNHLTFFAPSLAQMFTDAKFVWLHRHPGEFVRSGIRRSWYVGNKSASMKLIKPWEMVGGDENLSQVQKISLVWLETNRFISDFAKDHPDRTLRFNFNELNQRTMGQLIEFLEMEMPGGVINKMLSVRVNKQLKGSHPEYDTWPAEDKEQLRRICGPMSKELGHVL